MKPKTILKTLLWQYQKSRLGKLGKDSDISLQADIRGNKKSIFIGESTTICKYSSLEVDPTDNSESKIAIGDRTLISSFVILRTYGGSIIIGNGCFVNSFSALYGHGNLIIGNNTLIGPQVTVIPVNYGFKDRNLPFREQTPTKKGITIGDDVWIGAGVTIVDGCVIGNGCVIGAGAVVTKSIEPYSIVAGVPAKTIAIRE
ncbi:DapH/DapD/GlmU-related protein [Aerosakkonemataceae cyanobacterium BLCC-F50]|uniref:DapH/DapD/GlmU-related protein n=1 Tax=Floridaenema flaviceps BLCC-F50 TaxID=3153642 RepID=A0ABV4XRW9_9CYAN